MRQQVWHTKQGGVGWICEISTIIFAGKFIVVVNSKISASSIGKNFSLAGFPFGVFPGALPRNLCVKCVVKCCLLFIYFHC